MLSPCRRLPRARARCVVVLCAAVAIGFGAGTAAAQSPWGPPGQTQAPVVELHLDDGSVVFGTIEEESETYVIVRNRTLGKLRIPRDRIVSMGGTARPAARAEWKTLDPDYNSTLLGPTPETLPRGSMYFRSYEVLFLNVGFAPHDNLNFSIATLFPVSTGAGMVSAGIKYRLVSRERAPLGFAVAASGTAVSDGRLATFSAITGTGNRRHSLNASITVTTSGDSETGAFYIVNGDLQVSPTVKLLAEYGNSANHVLDDEDLNGFVNIGVRAFWDRTTFSLTGFRPLLRDTSGFIAFPVAVFARHW